MARKPKSAGRAPEEHAQNSALVDSNGLENPARNGAEAEPPKDPTELELEKLVFGDDDGFKRGLQEYRVEERDEEDSEYDDAQQLEEDAEHEVDIEADEGGMEGLDDSDLFFFDSGPTAGLQTDIVLPNAPDAPTAVEANPPAWIDSDDERLRVSLASNTRLRKLRHAENEDVVSGTEYTRRLQEQYERLYPVPEWAKRSKAHRKKRRRLSDSGSGSSELDLDDDSDSAEALSAQPLAELLRSTGLLTAPATTSSQGRRKFRPETIDIQRTKDVGGTQPSTITSLSFHPVHPILLSSGSSSSILTMHHISPSAPQPNPTLTTVHIPHHPITTCSMHPSGSQIFLSSRRRYFHIWDLPTGRIARVTRIYGHAAEQRSCERFKLSPCGRWMALVGSGRKGGGVINILDAKSTQWICQARVEGRGGVADLAWWADGEGLLVLGKGGAAIEYSVSERRVVARWSDEGAVGTTTVALGGNIPSTSATTATSSQAIGPDRWVAIGSQSGIVNVYDRLPWWSESSVPARPTPRRTLSHLVTPVSHLLFSPCGQLLLLASRWKRDALKLVHLPSLVVYRNWPSSGTPFGRVSAVAFGGGRRGKEGAGGGGGRGGEEGGGDGVLMLAVGNEAGKIRLWEVRG